MRHTWGVRHGTGRVPGVWDVGRGAWPDPGHEKNFPSPLKNLTGHFFERIHSINCFRRHFWKVVWSVVQLAATSGTGHGLGASGPTTTCAITLGLGTWGVARGPTSDMDNILPPQKKLF